MVRVFDGFGHGVFVTAGRGRMGGIHGDGGGSCAGRGR